ncbi:MAG: hypothetical protein IJJ17_01000 [Parasporobacterium sp.]|nr:hypothetical protein [Parasporobacterium sp.]
MVNQRKVLAMSRKLVFEDGEGREVLKLKKQCEDMPLWKSLGLGALCGGLLFLLLMLLAVLLFRDWFGSMLERLGTAAAVGIFAAAMVAFALLYSLLAERLTRYLYHKKRSILCGYNAVVNRLDKIRREQDS